MSDGHSETAMNRHAEAVSVEPWSLFDCPLGGMRLIEASAGTGKTWNITGLYLRLLLERGLTVDQILVVTFTKAATAQLRERIRERIVAVRNHLRDPGGTATDPFIEAICSQTNTTALRQLDLAIESFDEAAIYTIHGFCQRALTDVALSARMPLALEQVDDSALLLEAANDFWRQHLVARAPDVLPPAHAVLAAWLAQRRDSPSKWASNLRQRLQHRLATVLWPPDVTHAAEPDLAHGPEPDSAHAAEPNSAHGAEPNSAHGPEPWPQSGAALSEAHDQATALFEQARLLWIAERTTIHAIVCEARASLNRRLYSLESIAQSVADWDRLFASADSFPPRKEVDSLARLSSEKLRPNQNRPPPRAHPFFDLARALLAARAQLRQAAETQRLRLLRQFLQEAPALLARRKTERRVIAFDDMLWNLHQRLNEAAGTDLARRLSERFPAALIDEFQDTDPLQYAIFERIYGGAGATAAAAPALFFVGDPKQAIYSFRGADLPTYLTARQRAAARYSLAENQRSSAPLLAALEALYRRNQRCFITAGLDYQRVRVGSKARSRFIDAADLSTTEHGSCEPTGAALQLWQLPGTADHGRLLRKQEAAEAAARACAGEIVRLLEGAAAGHVRLDDRPLAGSDIAILVPTHARGRLMRRLLAEVGIASVELSQDSVLASSDAEDLGRVLAAIAEPARSDRIRAALATDAMGLDATAIAALTDDDERLDAIMTRFAHYRARFREGGIAALLRIWMRGEAVAARLLRRTDGERRLTNLMHLAEILQRASTAHDGLEALLRWFERARSDHAQGGEESQLRLESDQHLVQIVTVHIAKGLEYPIVFCPFFWDGNTVAPPPDSEGREGHDADGQRLLIYRTLEPAEKARRDLDRSAERMRLIYVALTRAVHRCYLVVGCYHVGTASGVSDKESRRSPLNWLVAGAAIAPEDWFSSSARTGKQEDVLPPSSAIAKAWAEFAGAAHCLHTAAVSLRPLPRPTMQRLPSTAPASDQLAALIPARPVPAARRISSYSGLIAAVSHSEAAARETDLFVDTQPNAGPTPPIPEYGRAPVSRSAEPHASTDADDILRFPRGPAAGECLHALLERVEFDHPGTWQATIAQVLEVHPQPLPTRAWPLAPAPGCSRDPNAPLARMLQQLLANLVAAPLIAGSNLTLAAITRGRRLSEFEFTLPVAHLVPSAVTTLMLAHGYPAPALGSTLLAGYLRGFIDMVFEHDGRYFLLDWKSNHLGFERSAYYGPALAVTMREHAYPLQSLLYCVALDRYLTQRLPGYDYQRDFGGSLYLFVRGVRPNWVDEDGRPAGVVFDKPAARLIKALGALLETGPAPVTSDAATAPVQS